MPRSAACRGKSAAAETIHRAHLPSAMRKRARALEAVVPMRNRARAMSNCARALEPVVATRNCALAMSNCALAVSVLRMVFARILRCSVRSMGAAHELAQIETRIVRNLSKTLTRSEC
jgi:hypothetical protein